MIKKQSGHMDFGAFGWILVALGFLFSPVGVIALVVTLIALGYILFSSWRRYRHYGQFAPYSYELLVACGVCGPVWLTSIGMLFESQWVIPAIFTASPLVLGLWPIRARGGYEGMGRMLVVIFSAGIAAVSWATFSLSVLVK